MQVTRAANQPQINHRYFIKFDYNGTPFHGWQIQPNANTVQAEINKALSILLREEISAVGCGRTDTGVHARNFIAHFDSMDEHLATNTNFVFKLNKFLPREIVVHQIIKMHSEAHSRFDASSRTYKYYITKTKDAFYHMYQTSLHGPIDVELMNETAKKLFNYTDFTSFSKVDTEVKTNNCVIMEAQWLENEHQLIFTIKADRFLRNMVRAIVGTLLEVGRGKITPADFCQIIEAQDRCKAGASVPAKGLFLEEVCYPYNL